MHRHIVIVDRPEDRASVPAATGRVVLTAREFVEAPPPEKSGAKVVNLVRDHHYLSLGYYASLLAEGRGDRVIPTPHALTEISSKRIYAHALPELTAIARRHLLAPLAGGAVTRTVTVIFGETCEAETAALGRRAFELFRLPLMALHLTYGASEPAAGGRLGWTVRSMRSRSLRGLDAAERHRFETALERFTSDRWRDPKPRPGSRYSLAILHDPDDPLPPSNPKALERFRRIGRSLGMEVELITRRDYPRLAEYDALFIRETTRIDHHTFRFATRAAQEGMPVIDDPQSIVRCTNKIYLAELLRTHNLPAPRTMILHRDRLLEAETLGYPVVLKIPDGAFSNGVFKAENREQLVALGARVFARSELALAQSFVYTAFDWRVGILNRQPIYACQYFMSRNHWQIVKHGGDGRIDEGRFRTFGVDEAPAEVIDAALRAAAPIGDGLYGVDLKQNAEGVFVIEVNDNPNIDAGVEDAVLKDELYRIVLKEFIRRIDAARAGAAA
ncbi:RimK family protein [Tistrella mobilis]|jgi:glutathione synthase/RimK-type ligase-like ATP-grasp enzyme|uniref:RimK family protein n=1 Tax=Tistrella mobilis TaxID=171437 RepID=UPI003557D08F